MVGWGCDSVVEHLLMMGKVLGSLSSIAQKKKKKKKCYQMKSGGIAIGIKGVIKTHLKGRW